MDNFTDAFNDVRIRRGWPAWIRMPLKWLTFLAVVGAVLFPHPSLLTKHVDHLRHLNQMINPDAPELAALEVELRAFMAQRDKTGRPPADKRRGTRVRADVATPSSVAASSPARRKARDVQKDVEAFVYEKVLYDWDWNIWGMADYMPTVSEIFARAAQYPDGKLREDCDGRAVLAASLLKRLGYDARLATDFGHVWVTVREGSRQIELMGPGHVQAVVSTDKGPLLNINWKMLKNIPVAFGYGVSVFPWMREAIIYAAAIGLLWHRRAGWKSTAVGALFALAGWQLMRANTDYWGGQSLSFWFGLTYTLIGAGVMTAASRKARRELNGSGTASRIGV